MKKLWICFGILMLLYQTTQGQEIRKSIFIRGNYMFERGNFNNQDTPLSSFGNLNTSSNVTAWVYSPPSKTLKGLGGGEIGVNFHFPLEEDLEIVTGAHLLLYRFEITRTPAFTTVAQLTGNSLEENILFQSMVENKEAISMAYFKIPFLVNYRFEEDILNIHLGISVKVRGISVGKVTHTPEEEFLAEYLLIAPDTLFIPTAIKSIETRKEFSPFMVGYEAGLIYQPWSALGIELNFYRSINRFINQDGFIENNLNAFSLGLRWDL